MIGSTSSVAVMRSLVKFLKQWASTFFGVAVLAVFSAVSIGTMCYSSGLCRQPDLTPLDIKILSTTKTETAPLVKNEPAKAVITKPVRLLLPSVNIGLDITDAKIDIASNNWPLSDDKAQYANFTAGLGEARGTMVIYGHGTIAVFEKTGNLKLGDELVLIDENGKTRHFVFVKKELVLPENVSFIYEDVPFRVVLFTCEGWNNQYRRLMYFTPI